MIIFVKRLTRGVMGITLFGIVFVLKSVRNAPFFEELLRHEQIHVRQQREWLYLPFFIIYGVEWLWHLLRLRSADAAYRAISFEREAYDHDRNPDYLSRRRRFATFRRQKIRSASSGSSSVRRS